MINQRQKFVTRKIILSEPERQDRVIALIKSLPIDADKPLEILVREEVISRGLDANALMWVGPLADIAQQGWVNGRTYSAEVWHHYFKVQFLPEGYDEDLTKDGYKKWDYTPDGDRVLVGSTKQLTKKGFSLYLMEIEAYGANIGVIFHENPRGKCK